MLEKYKLPLAAGLIGLILLGVGGLLFKAGGLNSSQGTVEILSVQPEAKTGTILVHLEGAVESPGVYELPAESRINDLLIRAGGLSARADRDWVAKNINLAQKLSDGAKLYIPSQAESTQGEIAGTAVSAFTKININTASASQLDSLWGIGEKRAADIIANRPYQTPEDLMTKAGIPKNVFDRIKEEITVF